MSFIYILITDIYYILFILHPGCNVIFNEGMSPLWKPASFLKEHVLFFAGGRSGVGKLLKLWESEKENEKRERPDRHSV